MWYVQAALQQVHELQKHSKAGLLELDRLRQTKDAHTMQLTQVGQEPCTIHRRVDMHIYMCANPWLGMSFCMSPHINMLSQALL